MSELTSPAGRLWIAAAPGRFFLVDDAAPRIDGPTWVADLDVGMARVALEAWTSHELTEADAAAHYRARLSNGAERLQAELERTNRSVGAVLPGLDALLSRLGAPDSDTLDGTEALSLLTGRPRGEVEADPAGSRDAVLDALQSLAGAGTPTAPEPRLPPTDAAGDATPEERAALGDIIQRWTFGASAIGDVADAPGARPVRPSNPQALLASLRRALASLGTFETTESREDRLARYRTDARAAIDRATAGWKPPMPTVEELLRMGEDQ